MHFIALERQWVDESKIVGARVRRAQRYKVFCDKMRPDTFVCEEAKSAMDAPCNANFSFGRRSLCVNTIRTTLTFCDLLRPFIFGMLSQRKTNNARSHRHRDYSQISTLRVLFVPKTPKQDSNGIVSSDFERKLHIEMNPLHV